MATAEVSRGTGYVGSDSTGMRAPRYVLSSSEAPANRLRGKEEMILIWATQGLSPFCT